MSRNSARRRPALRRLAGTFAVAAIAVSGTTSLADRPARPSAGGLPATLARSVEILRDDEPLLEQPRADAGRRGSAELGARLPVLRAQAGDGCRGGWLLVGKDAWVCADFARASAKEPPSMPPLSERAATGLPFDYYFVGPDGSLGYRTLRTAEEGVPDAELQPGFALAVVQVASKSAGDPFGLTTKQLWVPVRDLVPVRPASFRGVELTEGLLDVAWIAKDTVRVHESPAGKSVRQARLARQSAVQVLERTTKNGAEWVQIGESRWVRAKDVNLATFAPPPSELRKGERWIDIDLSNQVLTAYEGTRPVFATLVSSGKGKGAHPQATPKGAHRIWVKLRTTDMDNLEDEDANRYYAMEEVPWVMFFHKGYGLHGAYWHRSFGRVRSHGCVNLAPSDAERLFHWTSPKLPEGWSAILSTGQDAGTLVRIR